MKTNLPTAKSYIDRILSLKEKQAELVKQVTQVFNEAEAEGIDLGAMRIALLAINRRARAVKNANVDRLDATAQTAGAYLAEFYK